MAKFELVRKGNSLPQRKQTEGIASTIGRNVARATTGSPKNFFGHISDVLDVLQNPSKLPANILRNAQEQGMPTGIQDAINFGLSSAIPRSKPSQLLDVVHQGIFGKPQGGAEEALDTFANTLPMALAFNPAGVAGLGTAALGSAGVALGSQAGKGFGPIGELIGGGLGGYTANTVANLVKGHIPSNRPSAILGGKAENINRGKFEQDVKSQFSDLEKQKTTQFNDLKEQRFSGLNEVESTAKTLFKQAEQQRDARLKDIQKQAIDRKSTIEKLDKSRTEKYAKAQRLSKGVEKEPFRLGKFIDIAKEESSLGVEPATIKRIHSILDQLADASYKGTLSLDKAKIMKRNLNSATYDRTLPTTFKTIQ